jgi:hypothetical protein
MITLEDAICSHACSLESLVIHVTNAIPLECPLHLTVASVNSVQTLKEKERLIDEMEEEMKGSSAEALRRQLLDARSELERCGAFR